MDLTGKNIVVTGAGTGIGRAIAVRLSSDGAKVALVGRREAPLEETREACPGETFVATADVSDRGAVDAAFDRIVDAFGPLHAVVANAGIGGPNEPGDSDRWSEVVRTNLDGAYHTIRALEARLAEGDDARHAIVISSCLARFGVPGYTAYCASKAGVLGMVRAFAHELADRNVLVNAICPGWVETEMAREGMRKIAEAIDTTYEEARRGALDLVPLKKISEPDEIAGLVAFLLSPDARSITGATLDQNAGSWM